MLLTLNINDKHRQLVTRHAHKTVFSSSHYKGSDPVKQLRYKPCEVPTKDRSCADLYKRNTIIMKI